MFWSTKSTVEENIFTQTRWSKPRSNALLFTVPVHHSSHIPLLGSSWSEIFGRVLILCSARLHAKNQTRTITQNQLYVASLHLFANFCVSSWAASTLLYSPFYQVTFIFSWKVKAYVQYWSIYLLNNLTCLFNCCWHFLELFFLVLWLQSCIHLANLLPALSFPEAFYFQWMILTVSQNLIVKCPYLQPKHLYWAPELDLQLPAQYLHLNVLKASQRLRRLKVQTVLSSNVCLLPAGTRLSSVPAQVGQHAHPSATVSSRQTTAPPTNQSPYSYFSPLQGSVHTWARMLF